MTKTYLIALAAGTALATTPALAAEATAVSAAAAPAVEGAADGGLEDIVVTAQRREESLQSVPVAVTAVGSETLAALRVANIRNLSGLAPSLQVTAQGQQSIPLISIRGISSGTSTNSVDPKVGIYLDGVYVGRSVGAIFDLADIERVEVLRGPQGTLFGRNATGGALSLITATPTGEFGLKQTMSYGNFDAFRSRTVLDLPALGPLSLKIAYLHDEIEGDVDNLIGGTTLDFTPRAPDFGTLKMADKLGGRNVDAVQVAARIDASDALTIDYRYDYTDSRTVGRGAQLFGPLPGSAGNLQRAILGFQGLTGGITNLGTERFDALAAGTSTDHMKIQGHSLTINWDPGDIISVKSITAYRKFTQKPVVYDLAASGGLKFTLPQFFGLITPGQIGQVFNPANQPGPNDYFYSLLTARSTSQKQFTQEVQFTVTQDAWDLVAGVFYFHEKSPAVDVLGIFQPIANGVVITTPIDAAFGSGTTRTVAINDSMAMYGQGTWHINDQIDLTGGIRFTIDDRETQLIAVSGAQGGMLKPGTYKSDYSRVNYAGILTWKPNSDITAYAKISTAYVAGGIMNAIPYDPESLTSYEIGIKSQFLNNRVRANFAAYFNDYKDLQVNNFVNGVQAFNNAGKAEIPGFELEVDARPTDWLTLSGNVGYSDFKYKEFVLNGVDIADIAKPAYLSNWTTRLSAQVDLPEIGSNGGTPFARIDARWRSDSNIVNPLPADPVLADLAVTKAYWLVDGRIGISSLEIGGGSFDLSFYGQNLFNERYYPFGAPVIGLTAIYDRGRTYGIELSAKF
ncbi:hypothetical protein ACFB49_45090 [Sphingomonas sp. DBB INV C78]|uniref:TonB-dependent receptor n=1 Tax=Sphingomonas sp. DBB INV C78 TaxID=3349434 RepID=UPI0036D3F25A